MEPSTDLNPHGSSETGAEQWRDQGHKADDWTHLSLPSSDSNDSTRTDSDAITNPDKPQTTYVPPSRGYTSTTTGLITTRIPTTALDLAIPPQTLYWPLSVYSLTAGACLILAGTLADIIGCRLVFLTGVGLFSPFTLGCSLSQTGIQLVMFRAMQAALAMLAYALVQLSEEREAILRPSVLALLILSLILMPGFVWWMHYAEKHRYPVLMPSGLWKRMAFSSICLMVMLSYAVMQVLELYATLFFQKVQGLDALQSSVKLLPSMIVGAVLNLTVGLFVHRVSAKWLVFGTSLACAGAPLLMTLIKPEWPCWFSAFPAQILHPLSADVLFCVGLIIISQEFPDEMKSLTGAVFNTGGQFGTSIGLAVIGVIADSATQASREDDKESPEVPMPGDRAAFWAALGFTLAIPVISLVGLRKVGTVDTRKIVQD
ncbi:hypothetical protein OQA88_5967 [Cercophora sp. LCS_1]